LEAYEDSVAFYTSEVSFRDARRYIPLIAASRQFDPAAGVRVLDSLAALVQAVDVRLYEEHEVAARERIASRDAADWPIGTGVSTWTTANVELYLRDS
jgi:hypothetical protein